MNSSTFIYIYIFHLHAQVKLPLQPLQSSQVSRDNSGTTLSQREKNFFLSQPLDFNKSLGSLHITNGTWIYIFFSNQSRSVDSLISIPAGKLPYKKQSSQTPQSQTLVTTRPSINGAAGKRLLQFLAEGSACVWLLWCSFLERSWTAVWRSCNTGWPPHNYIMVRSRLATTLNFQLETQLEAQDWGSSFPNPELDIHSSYIWQPKL